MRLEAKKYLFDVQQAAARILEFTSGRQLEDYQSNAMLRAAVERQFEIIGEALAQLARLDENLVAQISEHRRIIDFRNILIHGYAQVDSVAVWRTASGDLPALRAAVAALLAELGETP